MSGFDHQPTYQEFARYCEASGIQLHDELQPDRLDATEYLRTQYLEPPSPYHSAIIVAANLERKQSGVALTNRENPVAALGPNPSLIGRMAISMFNGSRNRNQMAAVSFTMANCERLSDCKGAERYFTYTAQIMNGERVLAGEPDDFGWTIFTSNGEVVGLQKTFGERTTINFVPFSIINICYWPGSLFRADTALATTAGKAERLVTDIRNIQRIAFLRPTAYAAEPSEREREFGDLNGTEPTWSIGNLQSLAVGQVANCTVR